MRPRTFVGYDVPALDASPDVEYRDNYSDYRFIGESDE